MIPAYRILAAIGSEITVYHGFNNVEDALDAAKNGLTGKKKVGRLYSYENNNNPYGLFVTPDFAVAKDFVRPDSAIVEFTTKMTNLEPPVWPKDRPTVQGEKAFYFPNDSRQNRIARREKQRERAEFFNKLGTTYLEHSLFKIGEGQALFIGDINPNRLTFHVTNPKTGITRSSIWKKLTAQEYIEYVNQVIQPSHNPGRLKNRNNDNKLFYPEDDFNSDIFFTKLQNKYKWLTPQTFQNSWEVWMKPGLSAQAFSDKMQDNLWPKQILQAFRYFAKLYK